MLGSGFNGETKATDPDPGNRPSREGRTQESGEPMDGMKGPGAGSHRPSLWREEVP